MNQEQLNVKENNMSNKKNKSRKDSMKALATMGANMESMMSGTSHVSDSQSDDVEERRQCLRLLFITWKARPSAKSN